MLRIAIIDDEPLARSGLRRMLEQLPDTEIVGEAASALEARALLSSSPVDLIFLDIAMPEENGFALLQSLPHPPMVIFATAHAEHAVEAFAVQAADYLLKPISAHRLEQALHRARALRPGAGESTPPHQRGDRICLRTPERTIVLPVSDLLLLEAEGDFTRIFSQTAEPIFICQSIGHYQSILPAPPFVRLDRSTLLNLSRLEKIQPLPGAKCMIHFRGLGQTFPLGRIATKRLRELLPAGT